jgi:CheY-like chemotaxis protein
MPTILIIDENDLDRELAERTAGAHQDRFHLKAAAHADAALLQEADLVIVTCSARGDKGYDVIDAVRAGAKYVPVLVATESASPREIQEAYRRGANGVVRKPLNLAEGEEFLSAVAGYWLGYNLA